MKTFYSKFIAILFVTILSHRGFSQSVTFQFYHDLNNNCNYDVGEPFLNNLPGYVSLNYVNTSANTVVATASVLCAGPLSVSSPSLPATNTCSFTLFFPSSYPTFSINYSCGAYSNLSYSGTNYLPVKTVDQVGYGYFYSNTTGFYSTSTATVFPICTNRPTDSTNLSLNIDNIYGCTLGSSARTYSVFLDNVLLDMTTFTSTTSGYTMANGSMSNCVFSEGYYPGSTSIYISALLSSGPISAGNHTFEVRSTPIYTSTLSALNYSITLNAVPCTSITGSIYADCDNNCTKTAGDGSIYYGANVVMYNSTSSYTIYPNITGTFGAIVPASASQYSITSFPIALGFTPCAAASATTAVVASSGYDFGYQTGTSGYVDPTVYGPSVPGTTNPGNTKNVYINTYNYAFSYSLACPSTPSLNPGKIKALLDKNFTYLNVVGATPVPNAIVPGPNGDTLIWNVTNFNVSGLMQYTISAQMASTVSIGTGYTNYSWIYPANDLVLTNNASVFSWTIGLPYDPNNKISWASGIQPNGDIPLATTDLFYTINFQNIGTAPATNVKLADTLDPNLDWNTLQVISSSFPVQLQTNNMNGETFFNFNGINLPDSTTNEPGSHGYVHYRIKLKPSVPVNTVIKNRSHNYFDFMPAVATNQTQNKLVLVTAINEMERAASVFVAPNPVTDKVTVSAKDMIQIVLVYNNLGQIIMKQDVNSTQAQMDLSSVTDGVYFISVQFKNGGKTIRKVVKN